jgi:hypothetical protein
MPDSQFIRTFAPQVWAATSRLYGETVEYWPGGDRNQMRQITVVWRDGTEDEAVSPGRYSHAMIQVADLARPPAQGDSILRNGIQYDVARVNAYTIQYTSVVVQAVQESL